SRGSVSGTALPPPLSPTSSPAVRSRLRKSRERPGDSSVTYPTYGAASGTRRKASSGASGGRQPVRGGVTCSVLPGYAVAHPAYRVLTNTDRQSLRQATRLGGKGRATMTAGFAETGPPGPAHERASGGPADTGAVPSRGEPPASAPPGTAGWSGY